MNHDGRGAEVGSGWRVRRCRVGGWWWCDGRVLDMVVVVSLRLEHLGGKGLEWI